MDSGNSGSIQSSSGGDEEYDSRTESISALLNSSGQINKSHQHPLFHSFPRSPMHAPNMNSFLNLDMAWARGLRSQPNCTGIGGGLIEPSSSRPPISGLQGSNPTNPYMSPSMPLPSGSENGGLRSASTDQPNITRNSKKRSRASRRAPTTVLTTDTSNFRAMVQEFTGIPAPPFSASSFPRTRLDLFNTVSALRSGLSNSPPPPYLSRPRPSFASFPLSSSPSSSSAVASSSTAANSIGISTNDNTASASASATPNLASTSNYQLSSDLGLPKQQQNLLNMQNPMFTFQSQLQSSSPKYPFSGRAQGPMTSGSMDSQLKMGMLEDFSMNHGHVNSNTNLMASDGMSLGGGVGSTNGDQGHLRPFDWNYSNSQRVSSCKMNYTASSSDFHVEKGSENVSSRGEGMVDSWICSSD